MREMLLRVSGMARWRGVFVFVECRSDYVKNSNSQAF